MKILYSSDNNYSKIMYASLNSLLETNKNNKNIKIYIIDNEISHEMKEKINNLISMYKRQVNYISCKKICNDLVKKNDFPISAYARLFIQDEIDSDKVIYLDCDTIVKEDLKSLWDIDLEDNYVGGVIDPLPLYLKKAIGMSIDDEYINSGVMLINLKKWREINFRKKTIDFIEKHNYDVVHHDQGIINGISKGYILYIHPKYNLMPEYIYLNSDQLKKLYNQKNGYNQRQINEANDKPVIIHYIRKFYNRPWFLECTHPYKNDFLQYYYNISNELKSNPLKKNVKIRKFVYDHLPFTFYVLLEKFLDKRRINKNR